MSGPVYLVLVNFNGWSDTIECLESLLRSDYPDLRVLVVDNGSSDGSVERLLEWARGGSQPSQPASAALRNLSWPPVSKPVDHIVISADSTREKHQGAFPRVSFIVSAKNLGFAGGNNIALRLLLESDATGYAGLVNNDMVVAPDAVSAMVTAIEKDSSLGAVGGVVLDYNDPDVVQIIGGGWMSAVSGMSRVFGAGVRRGEIRQPPPLGYVCGGWLLMRMETLRRVGVLDERYFLYAEDADWGERMRAQGYRLGCTTTSVVWHKGSNTIGSRSAFQDYHVVHSALLFARKHAPAFTPFAAAYSVARCLLPKIVRGQWVRARSVLRAYGDLVRGT